MSLRCLLGLHRPSLTAITRRHDARPSWQWAVAMLATPLALSLAGCDTGAAHLRRSLQHRFLPALASPALQLASMMVTGRSGALKGLGCASPGSRLGRWTERVGLISLALLSRPKRHGIIWRRWSGGLLGEASKAISWSLVLISPASPTALLAASESPHGACLPRLGDLSCRMVRDGYAIKWPR